MLSIDNMKFKWKVFSFLLGFCGLLLLILWLFQIVFLEDFYKSIKVSETRGTALSIVENIDSENLPQLISELAQRGTSCIEVIFPNGETYQSNTLRECAIHRMSTQEREQLINDTIVNKNELYRYDLPHFQNPSSKEGTFKDQSFKGKLPPFNFAPTESLIYSKIIHTEGAVPIYILISTIISPVSATVLTLRYQLYAITIILIALAIGLAIIISRRVSKPIEELNQGAKELSKGNFNIKFSGEGFLEIKELSDTLNNTARELSKVDNLRKELMANISHDLRTPLSLIYSYAEIMHDFPTEPNIESPKIIMEETQRLSSLVSDVLDVSRLETGGQTLSLRKYNLTQSINSTINRMSELVKKDGFEITFSGTQDIWVNGDEVKITQVFYNLLINGINYTGTDKKILVKQFMVDNMVVIEVHDSGNGVSSEDLPYIWDRYYKVDKEHKRAITGTGLGLFIVKSIMNLHGGECGVQSVINEGSVFWFSIEALK